MKMMQAAFKYLKNYPAMTVFALAAIIISSLFEGASFGMLIPLIQSMTGSGSIPLGNFPFAKSLSFISSAADRNAAITGILLCLLGLIVLKNLFAYFSNALTAKLRFGISRDLSIDLMNNLIEYDLKYFDKAKSGHIMSTLSNETKRMGDFMLAVLQIAAVSGKVAVFIGLLFLISAQASAVIFLLIAIVLLPLELIMKKVKKLGALVSRAFLDYTFKLTEILNGIRLTRGSATEEIEKNVFKKAAEELASTQLKTNLYIYLLIPLSEILIFGIIFMAFIFLIHAARIDIPGTFPFFAAYLVILAKALVQLNFLNNMRSNAASNLAAFDKYEEMNDGRDKKTIYGGRTPIDVFRDSIDFRHVYFSYTGVKNALEDITVRIPKGRITAIVGISGSGKTTMVNLIPRFYDVTSGGILIDGVDIRDTDPKAWRRKIGYVSQDPFIFNADVAYNIMYGHAGILEEEAARAAEAANAHDFIMELSGKYKTVLGERGVRLSGGQKQRLSIARAIIHDPEILILDEATSSLDTETEKLINEAVDRLTKGRTVIAIAHRLSTILHADNIIVLHEGKVSEQGRHSELLKIGGLYKRLYEAQFAAQDQSTGAFKSY